MSPINAIPFTGRWLAGAAGLTAATYGLYAAAVWLRYGQHAEPGADERDALLDEFMPRYEVVERHHVEIAAPADVVMAAARQMDVAGSPISRAIFKARQLAMGAGAERARAARGVIDETMALGWGVLADVPSREIVMGAVTKPWEAHVKFIAVPPDQFASFAEPGFVKIVWTLRADPIGPTRSIFRTETRVLATDGDARSRFRKYWAFVSPGIWLIRRMTLGPLKADAERRAAMATRCPRFPPE
jgi:hypothetical protein